MSAPNSGEVSVPLRVAVDRTIGQMRNLCGDRLNEAWIEILSRELFSAAEHGLPQLEAAIQARLAATEDVSELESDLRKALLYWTQGDAREAVAKPADAAIALLEAGRRLSWHGELGAADELLSRANTLDSGQITTYWYLADIRLSRSYIDESAERESRLESAIAIWERGIERERPDATTSWAYVSRALINEQLARSQYRRRLWWEALGYLERALLLNEADALRWGCLARFHRYLNSEANAVLATSKALECDPESAIALEERAAIMANLGRHAEAEVALDKRLSQDPSNTWAKGVKAFVLVRSGNEREALSLIEEVVRQEPENIWNLDLQALCLRLTGDQEGAQHVYGGIKRLQEATVGSNEDLGLVAWALYNLGELDLAVARFGELSSDPLKSGDAHRGLGLCYLGKGDLATGEDHLRTGIRLAETAQELDELFAFELQELQRIPGTRALGPEVSALLDRLKVDIDARRVELNEVHDPRGQSESRAAERELEEIVGKTAHRETDDTMTWIGAKSGLARLYVAGKRWRDAAAVYRELLRTSYPFPEAHIGLEKAIQAFHEEGQRLSKDQRYPEAIEILVAALEFERELRRPAKLLEHHLRLGEAYWTSGRPDDALEHFGKALECATGPDMENQQARLHGRAAVVQQQLGRSEDARGRLLKALTLYRAAGPDPGRSLAAECRVMVRNVGQFWEFDAWLGSLTADPGRDAVARSDLAQVRESLMTYVDEKYELAPPQIELPIVTPIVLEVGDGLVPKVDPAVDGGRFINDDIAVMRKEIEGSSGVTVTGIRVRGNPILPHNGYVIMLDEVPQAEGRVEIESGYCAASEATVTSLGISIDRLVSAQDPSTGESGWWIPADQRERTESNGLKWRTATEFVLSHVADVLRRNLTNFLGYQEVDGLLTRVAGSHEALAATVPPDIPSRLRFARLLRALVREQVPITAWQEILHEVPDLCSKDLDGTLRACRLRLRKELPGNQRATRRYRVPQEWERFIVSEGGMTHFVGTPYDSYQLLRAIRSLVQDADRNAALLTPSGALRPYLRRLIECEFPYLMVLSEEELIAAAEAAPKASAAHGGTV